MIPALSRNGAGIEVLTLNIWSSPPRMNPEFVMTENGVQNLGIEFVLKFICAGEPCGDSTRQYAKSKVFKRSMEK